MSYYQHIDDFEGIVPKDNVMPSDVKRLISHCNHNYLTRYYFFSPSQRKFYRYYTSYNGYAYELALIQCKKSHKFTLIPDEDDGTSRTPNIRDSISPTDRFIQRIENMNKLILPKLH